MKTMKLHKRLIIVSILLAIGFSQASGQGAEESNLQERVLHYRAIDAVVWAMPLLNFKTSRDGHKAIGCSFNEIC